MFEMEGGMDGGQKTEITRERSVSVCTCVHVGCVGNVCVRNGMGWKVGHGAYCV